MFTGFCVCAPTYIKFIVCVWQLKACFCLIKQQQGMHKYTKIFNIIMAYYTYLIIQSETDTNWKTTALHSESPANTRMYAYTPLHAHIGGSRTLGLQVRIAQQCLFGKASHFSCRHWPVSPLLFPSCLIRSCMGVGLLFLATRKTNGSCCQCMLWEF